VRNAEFSNSLHAVMRFEPDREYMVRERSTRYYSPDSVFLIRDNHGTERRWVVQHCSKDRDGLWTIRLEKMTTEEEIIYEVMSS
jgi:hypothetical protein